MPLDIAPTLIVDLAIAVTIAEAVVLSILSARRGEAALPPHRFAFDLAAGLALMLGLRAALGGAGWPWIAAALAAAGAAHAVDLSQRWPRR